MKYQKVLRVELDDNSTVELVKNKNLDGIGVVADIKVYVPQANAVNPLALGGALVPMDVIQSCSLTLKQGTNEIWENYPLQHIIDHQTATGKGHSIDEVIDLNESKLYCSKLPQTKGFILLTIGYYKPK